MLKQTIPFTDFNENPRTVVEYFHLSKSEIIDLEARPDGGLSDEMRAVLDSGDVARILVFIKNLIRVSYGKKSDDGIHFEKSDELVRRFEQSAYYDDFLFGLLENDGAKASEFIRGIMPATLVAEAEAEILKTQQATATAQAAQQYAPDARTQFAQQTAAQQAAVVEAHPLETQRQSVPAPQTNEDFEAFRAWQAQQKEQNTPVQAPQQQTFRVQEDEPLQGFPQTPQQ